MEKEQREIQLEGDSLKNMSSLTSRIESNILKLSDQVLTFLYGDSHGLDVKSVIFFPNNAKAVVLNKKGKVIGVWEDPPGICRKPRKGEKFS